VVGATVLVATAVVVVDAFEVGVGGGGTTDVVMGAMVVVTGAAVVEAFPNSCCGGATCLPWSRRNRALLLPGAAASTTDAESSKTATVRQSAADTGVVVVEAAGISARTMRGQRERELSYTHDSSGDGRERKMKSTGVGEKHAPNIRCGRKPACCHG
jgi:hypothetical protein